MKSLLILAPAALALGACHPETAAAPPPHARPGGTCHADRVQGLIGKAVDDAAAQQARQRSGARLLRVLLPGQMMTMDFRPDRLNIILGPDRVATRVNCG